MNHKLSGCLPAHGSAPGEPMVARQRKNANEVLRGRRFVLAPYGSAGDVYPFLWLGMALRQAGASVVVVTSPVFSSAMEICGLRHVPFGTEEDFHRLAKDPGFWNPLTGAWRVLGASKNWFSPLALAVADLLRPAHSVLISPPQNFPATFAAKAKRRVQITVHVQPAAIFSADCTPHLGAGFVWIRRLPKPLRKVLFRMPTPVDLMLRPVLAPLCREAGIRAPRRLLVDWWSSPDGVLALFPEWFAQPQPDWPAPLRQAGFPLFDPWASAQKETPGLADFLNHRDAPVVFTAGSAMGCPARFFRAAVEAVRECNQRAVFVTAYPQELPSNLPPQIFTVRYTSFATLFPHAKAVIHHGGIGTTAQALAAGVPQLVTPHAHDQPDNAERVCRLGTGEQLPMWQLNASRLAHKLRRICADASYRNTAQKIAQRLPPPGSSANPASALDAIREFLSGRG